jgi:diguanylate cyclase (GGDEF)-like protein
MQIKILHDLNSTLNTELTKEDAFLPYRNRITYTLTFVCLIIFLPFVINNLFQGRAALEICLLAFLMILVIDSWAILRGKPPPIPPWTLVIPTLGGFVLTILAQHYIGLAWSYPVVLLFFFILPRPKAFVASALVIITIGGFLMANVEFHYTSRLIATLTLIAILTNEFVSIIETLHRQLLTQTITDPLTGAFNRRHMQAVLTTAIAKHERSGSAQSLLMVDIDYFKQINDQFGHASGDLVLKSLVATMSGRMRISDSLFRAGGEEFVILLSDTPMEGAVITAEDLCKQVAQSQPYRDVKMTISIGVSPLQKQDTLDTWLKRGDDALYQAKHAGRNRVAIAQSTSEESGKSSV